MTDSVTYADGRIELLHGDWFKLFKRVELGSASLVIVDGPYDLFGKDKGGEMAWDSEVDLMRLQMTLDHILKPNGQIVFFCNLVLMKRAIDLFTRFVLRTYHVWYKPSAMPINQFSPLPNCEFLLIFRRIGAKVSQLTWNPQDGLAAGLPYVKHSNILKSPSRRHIKSPVTTSDGRKWIGQVLQFPNKPCFTKDEVTEHPTQKSIALVRAMICTYSNLGDLVVSPFAGSGTDLLASYRENRKAFGVEIEKRYFDMASERIKTAVSQQNLFTQTLETASQAVQGGLFQ